MSKQKANKNFKKQKKIDALKNRLIGKNSKQVRIFIRFNYLEKQLITKQYVYRKLLEHGVILKDGEQNENINSR